MYIFPKYKNSYSRSHNKHFNSYLNSLRQPNQKLQHWEAKESTILSTIGGISPGRILSIFQKVNLDSALYLATFCISTFFVVCQNFTFINFATIYGSMVGLESWVGLSNSDTRYPPQLGPDGATMQINWCFKKNSVWKASGL